ncbi:hypothetical protein [Streptomyces sp. NPDC050585]|uniref:hypothetical protein n=1 Tax=Streptomyces sp. NPDC050585 TaxID=3365632 RepID=UPI00379D2FF6
MSSSIPVPAEERPWSPGDGPEPAVTTWPPGHRPAMHVWDGSRWRYAPVQSRQDHPDGRTVYRLLVPAGEDGRSVRSYRWPQDGLRPAHGPTRTPETAARINSANA